MSPHQDLAKVLADAITAWGSLWSDASVERAYSVNHYVGGWDGTDSKIVVLASAVESERGSRSSDKDTVTVGVVYLSRLTDAATATCDTHDTRVDTLRQFLRTQQRVVLASGKEATRINTSLPTPFDSEQVRKSGLFVAVITTQYSVSVEVGAAT